MLGICGLVPAGLRLNPGKRDVFLLGLDYPHRLRIDIQHVVGRTRLGGNFPDRHSPSCGYGGVLIVLHQPTTFH